jgi:hypothetical protein
MSWWRSRAALAVVTALAVLTAGCGYALAGRGSFLPDYLKIIGVPLFVNNTQVFEVEQQLTEAVRREFIGRGKYKVVPEMTGADAVLKGEILSISLVPASFTAERQASRYVATVVIKVEFRDLKADKVLWANPSLQFREEYELPEASGVGNLSTFFGQASYALDRLTSAFARTVVTAILEAF